MARNNVRAYQGRMNVREIRKKTGLDQAGFAARYRLPLRTVQDWESLRHSGRFPDATLTLLRMIEADPEGTAAIIKKAAPNE